MRRYDTVSADSRDIEGNLEGGMSHASGLQGSKYQKARPLLLCGVLAFGLVGTPALAVDGRPLGTGPDRATNDSFGDYPNRPSSGGYGGANGGPGGQRWDCRFYNPYVPFQNQLYCQ